MAQTLKIETPRWAVPLLALNRYKGAHGGRGSGKSHFFAELLIEEHIADQNQRSVCIREVQRSLSQSIKRLLEIKIQDMGADKYFIVQEAAIKSAHGEGLIIFQGMQNHTADSIKSLEGYDRALVEEAQSLSQHSLDLLRPTIRKPGSELWFVWNPRNEDDPVDALLRGDDPPLKSCVIEVNYDDNPFFPDVLKEEMEYDRDRDIDKYNHVWCGGYLKNSESRVFKNWRVDDSIKPKKDERFYFGADWGFANDPTTLLRSWADHEKRIIYVDHEAYGVGVEIDETPQLFNSVPGSDKWKITADSARPETISYMRRQGFNIVGAKKGKGSVEEGIEFLKSYTIVVHERCKHLIDELTMYSYKVDKMTDEVLPILVDLHNHCIDALRYALEQLAFKHKRIHIG